MINPRPNVFCLFLILLISCSDVAAAIVADKTNSGVTAFVAEITSMWDVIAVNSLDYRVIPCQITQWMKPQPTDFA